MINKVVKMDKKLLETFEKNRDEYLQHLKNLVSIDTQVIGHGILGGKEKEGQKYIEKLFEEMNADEILIEPMTEEIIKQGVERYQEGNLGHDYKERYNVIAKFKGNPKGRSILFN